MVELIKREYWSKSDAFILPLTHIIKNQDFVINSYLYWDKYSIADYKLTVRVEYGTKYEEFKKYLRDVLFIRTQKPLITECFDYEGFSVLVYDLSNWHEDIELILKGKFSKISNEAKALVKKYNSFMDGNKRKIYMTIYGCLYPDEPDQMLDGMTPLEYVSHHYGFDMEDLKGEICSPCQKDKETLVLTGQIDITSIPE